MASLSRRSKPERFRSADDWPPWTDAVRYTITGPSEADARWAVEHLNGDEYHHDGPTPDYVLDADAEDRGDPYQAEDAAELAAESHHQDLVERGLLPL